MKSFLVMLMIFVSCNVFAVSAEDASDCKRGSTNTGQCGPMGPPPLALLDQITSQVALNLCAEVDGQCPPTCERIPFGGGCRPKGTLALIEQICVSDLNAMSPDEMCNKIKEQKIRKAELETE